MKRIYKGLCMLLCGVLTLMLLSGCGKGEENSYTALEDYAEARIGIVTGSSHDGTAKQYFPNAERVYFSTLPDVILAVEQGKIDGYIEDEPFFVAAVSEGSQIERVGEPIFEVNNGFPFPQTEESRPLREQMNEFLAQSHADGTIERLREKWLNGELPTEHPDYMSLTGENGTIRIGLCVDGKPMLYRYEDRCTGFEMELLTLFGRQYGYAFEIEQIPFESIIAGLSSGKYDMGAGGMNITAEREESIDFSDTYGAFGVVMVKKADDSAADVGLWAEFKDGFEKTFIRENRWKMIVSGIGVTLLISLCAAVCGTLLGFGLYMLGRTENKALRLLVRAVGKVYTRIIAGTPVVVILMILFYVIFGSIRNISGVLVAIIGFTLTFGAFVYEHMAVSVNSVDRGQMEAAYSLGYPRNKTFFRIIFPQAMNIFLPSYCGQIVDLVKATAVVGYIAVSDLTKVGDIIRSNTYEAFFPLITTAVIYFLLTWLLTLLLGVVKRRFEPKRRTKARVLKGVKTA